MKFVKNFNNNAALVSDESEVDWVMIGNGIGFSKKLVIPLMRTRFRAVL